VTLWSNDGTVAGGVEPATAVVVDVVDGVFNAIIGDASTANMEPLAANIFNVKEKVFLRVWFSDNPAEAFEQLSPDRAITNPALLGSQLFSKLDIYVDPLLGDDRFPGHRPSHPKRTIQAAWNSLPALINKNVTIYLADGVYREEIYLKAKTVIEDSTISIIGNAANPDAVRITGADASADTTPVRDRGVQIVSQTNLFIQGILVDYCKLFGMTITNYSSVIMKDCKFLHNGSGLDVRIYSILDAYRVESGYATNWTPAAAMAFYLDHSRGVYHDCSGHHSQFGMNAALHSSALFFNCSFDHCTSYGVNAMEFSMASFHNVYRTSISNCPVGVRGSLLAILYGAGTRVNYSSNGTNYYMEYGSQIFN